MKVEIYNNSRCIQFVFDGTPIALNKQQIIAIEVLTNDKVKISTVEGASRQIYISAADVAAPNRFANAIDLHAMLSDLWVKGLDCCNETKARMDKQLIELNNIRLLLGDIKEQLKPAPQTDVFAAPRITDDSQPNILFSGFAATATAASDPGWAIKQTISQNNQIIELWSNGSKALASVWSDRYNVNYLPLATPKIVSTAATST
ncbi:hypothetical protein GCM10023093_26090 [Nemorincola caseinilytica]|uniref:DUF4376 domain-containing protein n=1 Tax=Nemorincola caseinilytica TaxID=2054315 RepID=A0ABP8NLR7_9BACT